MSKWRSWLKRKTVGDMRARTGSGLWHHRRQFFDIESYTQNRNFAKVKLAFDFDTAQFIKNMLQGRQKLNVMDAGPGHFNFSADIKRAFGKRIFLTAVSIIKPRTPTTKEYKIFNISESYRETKESIEKSVENAALVDDLHISAMENFRTNKKYDLIFDICGPLCYSRFKSRIFEQYLRFLRPGGKVVCEMHLTTFNRLPFSLGHAQTSNRPHYFETKTEGRLLVLTKKRNPHYKRKTRKKSAIAIIK